MSEVTILTIKISGDEVEDISSAIAKLNTTIATNQTVDDIDLIDPSHRIAVVLSMQTDSAAFYNLAHEVGGNVQWEDVRDTPEETAKAIEVVKVLERVLSKIEEFGLNQILRDTNGNRIGMMEVTKWG